MSALKRRDNKNRILQRGESQRQDGRYTYKYVDALGKTKYVYAWKLLPTDRTPKGKRDDLSLREKERIIQRDLYDGIDTQGGKNDTLPVICEKERTATKCNEKYRSRQKIPYESLRGRYTRF